VTEKDTTLRAKYKGHEGWPTMLRTARWWAALAEWPVQWAANSPLTLARLPLRRLFPTLGSSDNFLAVAEGSTATKLVRKNVACRGWIFETANHVSVVLTKAFSPISESPFYQRHQRKVYPGLRAFLSLI